MITFVIKIKIMGNKEIITIQSLSENGGLQIGYSDDDIVVVDSIQQFAEVQEARVSMNAVIICTCGKVQAHINGRLIELKKNEVAIVPEKITVTEVMITPDFDMKAMFLTNRILQTFLRDKMNIWNEMMYIHRFHIVSMDDDDMLFYTHFYEMLSIAVDGGKENPFRIEIIQSLLRSAMLGLCGSMKQMMPDEIVGGAHNTPYVHFQRFLDLLHNGEMKRHTVETYACKLCITPKYLTAICKKQSGKTANEWIREKVLEDIRYYLKQTDLSVKQIADKIGFPNASFFGKYVKEHFGMTPIQFRHQ